MGEITRESKSALTAGSAKFGVDSLVGFAGFASSVASFLNLLMKAPFLLGDESMAIVLRISCALVLSGTFLGVHLAAHAIARAKCQVLVGGSVVGLVAAGAALFAPIASKGVLLAVYSIASCGLALLSSLWFCFVCARTHKSVALFSPAAIGIGVVLCLTGGYLVADASRVFMILTWALSVTCMLVLVRMKPDSVIPEAVENRESDKRSKILWTSALMLSISNYEFGFLLATVREGFELALCLAVGAVVLVLLPVNFAKKGVISERSLSPLTPPLTIAAFLALYLFGDSLRLAALCALTTLFAIYTSFGIAAIAEHVRMSHLSPLRAYGKARFLDYLGLVFGLASGFAVACIAEGDALAAARLTAAIAVAYGFIASFCHKARFPEVGMEEDKPAVEAKGLWKKRCRAVSEQCDLSERQHEVLVLMSQGRNAKYIEQALSISLSTAQTHIRNIYRKTGVHSRQELLNLIEDTKLYGEE